MKKILFTTLFVICCTTFQFAVAQTKTTLGIRLNGNLTNVELSTLQNGNRSFTPGASVGGFTTIQFNRHFALQPELLLSYTEKKVHEGDEKVRFKYASVEIPVYAVGQFKVGQGKVFFGAGPQIGYGFSIDSRIENESCREDEKVRLEISHWYLGGGLIAGYEFRNRLSLNAGYKLSYDLNARHKTGGSDTHTISLGVGYRF